MSSINAPVIGLFLSLSSGYFNTDYPYVFVFIFSIYILISNLSRLKPVPIYKKFPLLFSVSSFSRIYLSNLWWLFPLVWVYGFTLSIINEVPIEYAIRNFFGLLLYGLIPFLLIKTISFHYLYKIFVIVILVSSFLAVPTIVIDFHSLFIRKIDFIGELRLVYNSFYLIHFSIIFLYLYEKFNYLPKPPWFYKNFLIKKSLSFFYISLISLPVVFSMSKGYTIIFFVILFMGFFRQLLYSLNTLVFPLRFVASTFSLLFLILFFLYFYYDSLYVLVNSFSDNEIGNFYRSQQADYLIAEFSFFGKGLGSALDSGYVRDNTGYGFELTYLNLVHKLGIFSIVIFIGYFCTLFLLLKNIFYGDFLFESVFLLGLMSYLIQGAGNPILFSSTNIIIHTIVISVLLKLDKRRSL